MERNPNLPDDILIEIFSILPPKSVGRCRCLSRIWRARLSDTEFIRSHFNLNPHQENLLLITTNTINDPDDGCLTPIIAYENLDIETAAFPIKDEPVLEKLDMKSNFVKVLGSCHGLVLMLGKEDEMFLVNPLIREQVSVPNSPGEYFGPLRWTRKILGLGYDSLSYDYKIVTLGNWHPNIDVSVYSTKKGVWVKSYSFPSHIDIIYKDSGAFVDGALHWFGIDKKNQQYDWPPVIVAFDMATEEFREVPVPTCPNGAALSSNFNLFVLGGRLCIVERSFRQKDVVDAWIMKKYGVKESWMSFSLRVEMRESISMKPLCYVGEKEDQVLLVDLTKMLLFVCDLKEETKKVMFVNNRPVTSFLDGCVFVESLVSPKQLADCS